MKGRNFNFLKGPSENKCYFFGRWAKFVGEKKNELSYQRQVDHS